MTNRVTVGIRFHDISRIQFLERCLFSISAQVNVHADVCIAVQGIDRAGICLITEAAEKALALSLGATLEILDIPNPEGADLRSKLLNEIVDYHYKLRDSRFLCFIDYDDIWFSHALSTLSNSLASGQFAMSFADIHAADVVLAGHSFLVRDIRDAFQIPTKTKSDLRRLNFLPLHSYMFCTDIVPRDLLKYDESLCRLEDYDILLKVARSLPVLSSCRSCLIGLYNFYVDYRRSFVGSPINTMHNPFTGECTLSPAQVALEQDALSRILCKNNGLEWMAFFGEDF